MMSDVNHGDAGDERQYQDKAIVDLYDQLNPLGRDSDYFISACEPGHCSILDLGCGTGLLSAALASRGHHVVGVDPSEQMLQVARTQTDMPTISWHCADARHLDLGRQFDRVIATGHVFQVFLNAADQLAFLKTARRHVNPDGLLLFDTRNPQTQPWRAWTPEQSRRRIDHDRYGAVDTWHEVTAVIPEGVAFKSTYDFVTLDKKMTSESKLAFPSADRIVDMLGAAGLDLVALHGDWDATPFQPFSPEIIVVAQPSDG